VEKILLGVALCLLEGYLLGSLSFSIIVSRVFKGDDIRNHGSKNAGMTNILRTYGKKYALLCGVGDFSKGLLAVLLGRLVFQLLGLTVFDAGYTAGMAALMGHLFPLYFGFRGGKGVLTGLGVMVALSPVTFVCVLAVALPLLYFTRIVSLASITGAALYPFFTVIVHRLQGRPALLDGIFAAICAVIILYMHRANIQRLRNGTEYRFGQKKEG
jgi:glycerol-3-phosphate acyltransferase PlsY